MLIKSFRTLFRPHTHPGRLPVPVDVKILILSMNYENLSWRNRRIRDELLKLEIDLHRRGKIRKSIIWMKLLKNHANSLFAMDTIFKMHGVV